jgi:hypothetical protein
LPKSSPSAGAISSTTSSGTGTGRSGCAKPFAVPGFSIETPSYAWTARLKYLDKSAAYAEVEALFAQGRVEILDHPQLVRELKLLERRPRIGGKAIVDHPHGGHDDHANALALAVALAAQGRLRPFAGPVLPRGVALGVPSTLGVVGAVRQPVRPHAGVVGGQARFLSRWYG